MSFLKIPGEGVKCVCPYCRKIFEWPPAEMKCPGCAKTVRPPGGYALPGKEERRKKIAKIHKDYERKHDELGPAPEFRPARNPAVLIGIVVAFCFVGLLLGTFSLHRDDPVQRAARDPLERTIHEMMFYATALEHYKLDIGNYPLSNKDGGLRALVEDPGEAEWSGPYAIRIKRDWWGNTYFYDCTNGVPTLASAGPDGEFGTGDDISAPAEWFTPHPGFVPNDPARMKARPAAPVMIGN